MGARSHFSLFMAGVIALSGAVGGAYATQVVWSETGTVQRATIYGLPPNSSVDFKIPLRLFNQTPKYCGYVRVSWPKSPNVVNAIDDLYIFTSTGGEISNQIPLLDVRCVGGANWENADGTPATNLPDYFYRNSSTGIHVFIRSGSPIDINSEGFVRTVTRTTNACGMAVISFKKFTSVPSWSPAFSTGTADYSMLSTAVPPVCVRGVLYVPIPQ